MHQLIRSILSRVSGIVVEKRASAISGVLEVWYQNGRYVLHSAEANYSFDTLHRVFQQAFKKLNVKKRNPKKVLILGFGAGSVATILCDELRLSPSLTGIEVDPEVIQLAEKYFHIQRFSNLNLHITDAHEFVSTCTDTFDLIVSDVFIDKNVPEKFLEAGYFTNLIQLTGKGGLGLVNVITETKAQRKQAEFIQQHLEASGVACSVLRVSSINTIISWIR
jgi:spermidine synthase